MVVHKILYPACAYYNLQVYIDHKHIAPYAVFIANVRKNIICNCVSGHVYIVVKIQKVYVSEVLCVILAEKSHKCLIKSWLKLLMSFVYESTNFCSK